MNAPLSSRAWQKIQDSARATETCEESRFPALSQYFVWIMSLFCVISNGRQLSPQSKSRAVDVGAWQKKVPSVRDQRCTKHHFRPRPRLELHPSTPALLLRCLIASGRRSPCFNACGIPLRGFFPACSRHEPSTPPRWPAKRHRPRPRANRSINRLTQNWCRVLDWSDGL